MHILVLPSWYPYTRRPLSGIFFREQALALCEAGYQIGVVAPILKSLRQVIEAKSSGRSRPYWEDDDGVATLRDEFWSIPKFHRMNMSRWLSIGRRLIHEYLTTKGRPDIVHVHSTLYAGVLAAEIKEKYQIPYIITEHSSAYARGLIQGWQVPYISTAIRKSSWRVAVSQELAHLLESLTSVPSAEWDYLPNMVDVEFFSTGQTRLHTSNSQRFLFFTAAFLTQNKGMTYLIDAFAKTFGQEDVELWMGGDGEERKRLEKQVALLGLEEKISFLGSLNREQMRSAMQECDAFVLPSLYETFGVVLIEALATGKPVIATRCGGPESIVHEENGFLVAPADPDTLGEAMRQMVKSINHFDKDAIRADCIHRFGKRAVIEELGRIYRLVLGLGN